LRLTCKREANRKQNYNESGQPMRKRTLSRLRLAARSPLDPSAPCRVQILASRTVAVPIVN
jgi:hypothetical protein